MTKKEFYNKIVDNTPKWADRIYGYPLHANEKYIIAHTISTLMQKYDYNAMDSANNHIVAIVKAIYNHHRDGLEWVVIKNF